MSAPPVHQGTIDVLHVIESLAQGGAERNLYYLAPCMAKSGLRYGICCLAAKGQFAPEVESLGLPVIALGHRRRNTLFTIVRLTRLLKARKVSVLHTHLFECGVIGRLAAWLAGVPAVVTHEHGKTLWKKWYHRWFERLAIRRTDLRIAVSDDIRNLRIKWERTPPEKIRVVVNAVGPEAFKAAGAARDRARRELGLEGAFVVGTVGRLVDAKRYDLFMEVARDVCAARPEARFLLVGDGELRASLVALRDSLGLAERVVMTGPRVDIPEILAAMDLYMITSQREGLPLTLIEAMMASRPIIATAVGGIPEALSDGNDGILVKAGDRQALVAAALSLVSSPEKREAMGLRAREKAIANYSAQAVLGTLEAIYASILEGKGLNLPLNRKS